MKRSIILALAFVLASFGMTALETQAQGVSPCAGKEPVRYVAGGKECLMYKAFGADAAGKDPTLVVFLNGDLFQEGGAADDMYKYAAQFARPGVIGVAILRPAFSDREGNKSTDGERSREFDSYTPRNIESVALAIDALKRRYGAKRVILVAHTAGAAYAEG